MTSRPPAALRRHGEVGSDRIGSESGAKAHLDAGEERPRSDALVDVLAVHEVDEALGYERAVRLPQPLLLQQRRPERRARHGEQHGADERARERREIEQFARRARGVETLGHERQRAAAARRFARAAV